jgi:trans-aconitate 2-methyltransferase
MPTWDAQLYLQFANERTQPALDLVARLSSIPDPQHVVDLGCGPGNSTAILRQRWPDAKITGLDNSPEMIAAARQSAPSESWLLADAASWNTDTPLDLLFTNAAIQWIPHHAALMPHLMEQLKPAGVLAVQMPSHYLSPLHQITLQVANDPAWNQRMDSARNALTKESPSFYYDVLQPLSSQLNIWETEYFHIMESPAAILKWFSGTGLRPFLEALETEEQKREFERQMLEGYTKAYLPQKDGRILFPFRRLFITAVKKA